MLGLDAVSIDADMFVEYGAHSLLMARFCARVRALEPSLQVAMRDVYANPTLRRLARALDAAKPVETDEPRGRSRPPAVELRLLRLRRGAGGVLRRRRRASRSRPARPRSTGSTRRSTRRSRSTPARSRSRSCGSSATTRSPSPPSGCSSAASAPGAIPIWSARYFRFWAAKLLVRSAPAVALRRHAALQRLSAPARREDRRATR